MAFRYGLSGPSRSVREARTKPYKSTDVASSKQHQKVTTQLHHDNDNDNDDDNNNDIAYASQSVKQVKMKVRAQIEVLNDAVLTTYAETESPRAETR